MSYLRALIIVSLLIRTAGFGLSSTTVTVTGDNVNLRSSPTNRSEVVGQVSTGEALECKGAVGGWLQVTPPDKLDLWVYDEFISDDKVLVSRLQVRGGPGINYRAVGMLSKADSVISRGVKGEWRKIAPPASCSLWISSDFASLPASKHKPARVPVAKKAVSQKAPPKPVSAIQSPKTKRPVVVTTRRRPKPLPVKVPKVRDVSSLIDLEKLQKDVEQGATVKRTGVVKPSGMAWRRPSDYRLVIYDKWDRALTICYIIGDERRLTSMLSKDVYLVGSEYWIQGVRYPVVIADSIILNN